MIELAYPWLLILLPAPLLVIWLGRPHREARPAVTVPFMERLIRLTGRKPSSGAVIPRGPMVQRLLAVIVWLLLMTALARPQYIGDPITKTLPGRDMLVAVDLSGSMEEEDFTDESGGRIDRLSAVKLVLDDFLSRREGDRVGLMFFGSAPFMQAPFTDDLEVLRTLLKEAQVRMAGPQTMLGDAIGKAVTVFESSDLEDKVLLLLTDGNDTQSLVPPVKAAEIARDNNIRIHVIGMGDPTTVGEEKLDTETLKEIAETTGGKSFMAINREELEAVYKEIDSITTREVKTLSHRPVRDLYHWPLAAAVLLLNLYHIVMLIRTGRFSASKIEDGVENNRGGRSDSSGQDKEGAMAA